MPEPWNTGLFAWSTVTPRETDVAESDETAKTITITIVIILIVLLQIIFKNLPDIENVKDRVVLLGTDKGVPVGHGHV